jgi:hypothetical protein
LADKFGQKPAWNFGMNAAKYSLHNKKQVFSGKVPL